MSAANFVKSWQKRSLKSKDCFEQFFYAWTALVIAARLAKGNGATARHDSTDRTVILAYVAPRAEALAVALGKLTEETAWLARRTGTETGQAILDVHDLEKDKNIRQALDYLSTVWNGQAKNKPKPEAIATGVVELLNHVRNNLFHGRKGPDEASDHELLLRVNPILLAFLAI